MSLTREQIEAKIIEACHPEGRPDDSIDDMHIDHDSKHILWWDEDEEKWCVNGYTVKGNTVEVNSMPYYCFSRM